VALAAGGNRLGVVLLGVAAISVLTGVIAVAAVGTAATLTTFLLRAPLVAAPLLGPALLHVVGLVRTPLLYASPVTSGVDMLRGRMSWAGLAWQLAWIAGAAAVATRAARRSVPTASATDVRHARPWPPHPGRYARLSGVRSFVRADRRTLVRDGLLVLLAVSVPFVAAGARLARTAGIAWARDRHGVDLVPLLPLVWVVLLVVHTPLIFGTLAGLLLLEDRDGGVLPAVATTRASIVTLLAYRLGATAACTAVGLAIGLAIAGTDHAAGVAGLAAVVVAAAAVSAVPALLMAAFAANRVQGVAVMKMFGLPLYLPLASWFLEDPLRWLFAPVPSSWAMWAMWATTPGGAALMATGAVVTSGLVAVPLSRRFLHRAT
jgi:hypothetical protein